MRLWVRLVTLCLSLALLGGVLLHETASAKMSLDMAAVDVSAMAGDGLCPACALDDANEVVCDLDCTAPALIVSAAPQAAAGLLRLARLAPTRSDSLHGLDLGVDPTPPRSTLLS